MRIFDLVPFFNEVELLRLRIDLLSEAPHEVVHVVAEGDHTHQGEPKPLYLDGVDLPGNVLRVKVPLGNCAGAWDREETQRDALRGALPNDLHTEDLVLSCDVDELVDPVAVDRILEVTERGPAKLGMQLFYYGLEWQDPKPWWHPVALRARDLRPLETLSDLRTRVQVPLAVTDAGWHVSYWGGANRRREKIEAYAHAEVRADANMRRRVEAGGAADPHGNRLLPARLDAVHPLVRERLG